MVSLLGYQVDIMEPQTLLLLSPLLALLVTARKLPFVLNGGQPNGLGWPKLQSCQPLPY